MSNTSLYYYIFLFLCQFDAAKLRKLRPSFKETGGSVTAGNASSIRLICYQNLLNIFVHNDFYLDALLNYFCCKKIKLYMSVCMYMYRGREKGDSFYLRMRGISTHHLMLL